MYRYYIQFKLEEIWRTKTRLELESGLVLLTFLNLVIDSNLSANNFIKIEIYDVSS